MAGLEEGAHVEPVDVRAPRGVQVGVVMRTRIPSDETPEEVRK
jgi:hypothetical protein